MSKIKKKIILWSPVAVVILAIIALIFAWRIGIFEQNEEVVITTSTLTETIDVSELSTSQFTYWGIAEIYKNEKKKKVKCYVRYETKIKAGIDMKEVIFDIDDANKTVKPILPEIKINVNTVDEKSLSFLPEGKKVELKEVLSACKKDAEKEALQSKELMNRAEDNLKATIEALLYPVLDSKGYTIVWE